MADEPVVSAPQGTPEGGTPPPTPEPKPEASKAPEKYELKFDGDVQLDPEAFASFEPLLRKHNISNEVAQELASAFLSELDRQDSKITELYTNQRSEWAKSAKADKEFGGEKFDQSIAVARRAIARFASPELKELLNQSGLGDHPEVIRAFIKVGSMIQEDGIHQGGTVPDVAGDLASRLFNHPTSKHS